MHTRLALMVFSCLPVFAETSATSTVVKSPGDMVTLEIAAASQSKQAPITLHFDVVFPAQLITMEGEGELGTAAYSSGKSIQGRVLNPYSYRCVISGGQKPIADGQIAIFHFRVLKTAKAGPAAFRIERATSTTVNSKLVSLNDTEVVITIR